MSRVPGRSLIPFTLQLWFLSNLRSGLAVQYVGDLVGETTNVNWLRDIPVEPRLLRPLLVPRHSVGGEGYDRDIHISTFTQLLKKRVPVAARELDIHEDQRRLPGVDPRNQALPVGQPGHLVARQAKHRTEQLHVVRAVFHYENARHVPQALVESQVYNYGSDNDLASYGSWDGWDGQDG